MLVNSHNGEATQWSPGQSLCGKVRLPPSAVPLALILGVFVLDLSLSAIAVGPLYVLPLLVAHWLPRRSSIIQFALLSTALSLLGFTLPAPGPEPRTALVNWGVTVLATWTTAFGLWLFHRTPSASVESPSVRPEGQSQRLLDQVPAILWTTDRDLRITQAMGAGLAALQGEGERIVGNNLASFWADTPESIVGFAHQEALEGRTMNYQVRCRERTYQAYVAPLVGSDGRIAGCIGTALDITDRVKAEESLEGLLNDLQDAMAKVRILRGLLPICSSCRKVRTDSGFWDRLEKFVHEHSELKFSHGYCPDCLVKFFPDVKL